MRLFYMNIFSQLRQELEDFNRSISIVAPKTQGGLKYTRGDDDGGYTFNQRDLIDGIDMAYNSKYKSGKIDSDGQRKTYLNIVKFNQNVAEKMTDIDVKNYLFIPESYSSIDPAWLTQKMFEQWARKNHYGEFLNEINKDYSKYGTCVWKRTNNGIKRVKLRNLINKQDAESLKQTAKDGGYVIEEHLMTEAMAKRFPGWSLEGIEFPVDGYLTIYERHGLVKRGLIDEINGTESGDPEEMVLAVCIVAPDASTMKGEKGKEYGKVLFIEEEDEAPYQEAHWDKQDGRWLGIGEVENQMENQIAKNLTANLRRRALEWASRKYFQTQGEAPVRSLTREARDGTIFEVGPNGLITEISKESRDLGTFAQDEQSWDENTRQKSFSFEVATGESMPSGSPFRLGVLLSNSVANHFELKKERLGLALEKSFDQDLIPLFMKTNSKDMLALASTEEGIERVVNAVEVVNTNKRMIEKLLDKEIQRQFIMEEFVFDWEAERKAIRDELNKNPYFFINNIKEAIKNAKFMVKLVITGENEDVQKHLESFITLYQTMAQTGDPRAERLLEYIMSLTGKNVSAVLGQKEQKPNPQMGGGDMSALNQLIQPQNVEPNA